MARRVEPSGGPSWVWVLVIVLILASLALLAWAFLVPAPQGTVPAEESSEQPAATPSSGVTSIGDLTSDPARYSGNDVTIEGRITRIVGDHGLYVVDREGGSEILAILETPVAETDLRNDGFARFSGTVQEVTSEDLEMLADIIDKPTLDALAGEKAYLSVGDFEEVPS